MFAPWVADSGSMNGRAFVADGLCSGVMLFGCVALVASFAEEGFASRLEVIGVIGVRGGIGVGHGHGGHGGVGLLDVGRDRSGGHDRHWLFPLCGVGCQIGDVAVDVGESFNMIECFDNWQRVEQRFIR